MLNSLDIVYAKQALSVESADYRLIAHGIDIRKADVIIQIYSRKMFELLKELNELKNDKN